MRKVCVVVINGYPNAGKDTFVELCRQQKINIAVYNHHSSDWAKDALRSIGYNEENKNDPRVRDLLAHMVNAGNELWDASLCAAENVVALARGAQKGWDALVFIHERDPIQIERLSKEFNATTLLILRPKAVPGTNPADQEVENYWYDVIIHNNGSLEDLTCQASDFMHNYLPNMEGVL